MKKKGEVPVNVSVSEKKAANKLRLKIDKMVVEADYGETITWQWTSSTQRVFSVQFAEDTPFKEHDYVSQRNKISQAIVYDPGKHKGEKKEFKYTIAAYYGRKVYILDPVIIVPKPPKA